MLNTQLKEDSAMCQRLLDELKRGQTFQEFPGFAWRCLPFVPWMNSEVAYIAGERCAPRLRLTPVPAGTKKLQTLGRKVPNLWGCLWSTRNPNKFHKIHLSLIPYFESLTALEISESFFDPWKLFQMVTMPDLQGQREVIWSATWWKRWDLPPGGTVKGQSFDDGVEKAVGIKWGFTTFDSICEWFIYIHIYLHLTIIVSYMFILCSETKTSMRTSQNHGRGLWLYVYSNIYIYII